MLGATAVAFAGMPVLLPLAIGRDLVRRRFRLPTARTYGFLLQYLFNDSVEILLAPLLWVQAGFGRRLNSEASIDRHTRLQQWSVDLLERRAEQLLGLTVEMDDSVADALADGPVIAISRHVSLFDATLPGLACTRSGLRASGVIMAELLADPGFDLIYGRVGSVFIPRDDGPAAIEAIAGMTRHADERSAYIIYPEGRLFTPAVHQRSMARLAGKEPERAERLAKLDRMLPPRPGGLFTLLDAVPSADLVVVDHRGLDRFPRLKDLGDAAPASETIRVSARRIARADIPTERDARTRWLDQLWLDWDEELNGIS